MERNTESWLNAQVAASDVVKLSSFVQQGRTKAIKFSTPLNKALV
ncbi:hypothetical protein [Shewanella atlantica]|nr:hypothetical protein [Shewanella atlantica]